MTSDDIKWAIISAVERYIKYDHNPNKLEYIDLVSKVVIQADEAKQELRKKGYGWTGLSLLETVKTEVPDRETKKT